MARITLTRYTPPIGAAVGFSDLSGYLSIPSPDDPFFIV